MHLSVLLAAVHTDGYVTDMGVNGNWVVWECWDLFGAGRLSLQDRKSVLLVVVRNENSVFCSVDSFSCPTVQLAHVTVCLTVQLAHVTVCLTVQLAHVTVCLTFIQSLCPVVEPLCELKT